MIKFKLIGYNPGYEDFDMEHKVNTWLRDHPNISIQNVIIRKWNSSPTTYIYIFYEEKENNNE